MNDPAARRWLLLWLALAAIVAVRTTARPPHRGVILDHLEFGRRLVHGENVYGDWRSDRDAPVRPLHAPYPPSFGLLTAPFAVVAETLGLPAARLCWVLLQLLAIAALFSSLRAQLGGHDPPDARATRWLALLTLLLLARFLLRDLHGGGGNTINVALCALAFANAERARPRAAGLWLGVSLATKPTQIWLLPILLVLGHRRAAGWTLVTGLCCVLLSLLLLRFDTAPWLRWFEGSWLLATQTDPFAAPALGLPPFEWMNQSLRLGVARWLTTVPPEFLARVPFAIAPGLGLPMAVALWTTRVVVLAAFAAVLLGALRARRGTPTARALVVAATLAFSLLASPLSWKAHHLALLPLVWLLLWRAHRERRRGLLALLLVFVLTCGIGGEILGDDVGEWQNSLYLLPMFDLALLAAALRAAATAAHPSIADTAPAR